MVRTNRDLSQVSVRIYSQDLAQIKRVAYEQGTDTSCVIRGIIRTHFSTVET